MLDVIDNKCLTAGPAGVSCDPLNQVSWDNLNASSGLTPTVASVATARSSSADTLVTIDGAVVTGAYNGFFYVEDTGRVSGIRINSTASVVVGQTLNITGYTGSQNGEPCVNAYSVTVTGTGSVAPLGVTNQGAGLRISSGLLVTAWGT